MKTLYYLTKRNTKLYFKDKGMFFSSLITPIILLVLYATFLKKIYTDSFNSALLAAGAKVKESVIEACVGGQLISSLLAVICVTVAFCSNLLMIKDKTSGARKDLTVSPLSLRILGLSYYLSTLVSTLIITFTATAVSFIYLGLSGGWYLSVSDVFLILFDVFLLSLFGTALSSCVNFFLSSDGQASAVGTIVSAGYGFICGAYMPISSFGSGLKNFLSFLPGTYGTSLLRNHALRGSFEQMAKEGFPESIVTGIKKSVDCSVEFYGKTVQTGTMYLILIFSIILLIGVYCGFNILSAEKTAGKR